MGLQPRAGIKDVGGDVIKPGGQRPAHAELAWAPVSCEGGVEAVRHQFRGAGPLGPVHGLVRELDGARGLAGVGPAAGQRSRQPRACPVVGRAGQHVIQLSGQLSRFGPEQVDRGRTEHRLGPPVEVVLSLAASRRLVIQAGRHFSPAGPAGSAGQVEEITGGRRGHHTSS